jgi:hypothetical protein
MNQRPKPSMVAYRYGNHLKENKLGNQKQRISKLMREII